MISQSLLEKINARFPQQMALLGCRGEMLTQKVSALPAPQRELVAFLYATLPLSDIQSYPFSLFLGYVDHALFLYNTQSEVQALSEELLLHYVLYPRVNNEELVPHRRFFYQKVSPNLPALSPREKVLEVNRWLAKEASYQSTDDRTASPLAVYRAAMGRCGEESTFGVHVYRSVGIPARQVYVPRWSHTDDNHAWIEVWVDGDWAYLGACEPEEVLNRGWFNAAATRAMLVHSRKFDPFLEDQAAGFGDLVVDSFGAGVQLNQLHRYAQTKTLTVKVQDKTGAPVAGASVRFEVGNYGEFSPLAVVSTDTTGRASLITGIGTVHLHAFYNDTMAEAIISPEQSEGTLTLLPQNHFSEGWQEYVLHSPKEGVDRGEPLSLKAREQGKEKLAMASHLREKKIAAFVPGPAVKALLSASGLKKETREILAKLLPKTRGNFGEIKAFLTDESTGGITSQKVEFLSVLAPKDLYDVSADLLLSHLRHSEPYRPALPKDIFLHYVQNPRVRYEVLTSFREPLERCFSPEEKETVRRTPALLWEQLNAQTTHFPALEYPAITANPLPVLEDGVGSELAQKILFVVICRTLGVPARLRRQDNLPEYYQDGTFHTIGFVGEGTVTLRAGETSWNYYRNWSLGRLENGVYQTLDLRELFWRNDRLTVALEAGQYRLLTTTRLTNGDLWVNALTFVLAKGEAKEILLYERKATAKDLLEDIPLGNFSLQQQGRQVQASLLTPAAGVYLWLTVAEEPTEHILNEILADISSYQKVQSQLVFVLPKEEDKNYPTLQRVLASLPEAQVAIDPEGNAGEPLARRTYRDPYTRPFILVVDKKRHSIFSLQGYNVGTGDMLLTILELAEAI